MSSTPTSNSMTYRRLGHAGTRVSTLSLGGWTTFGGSMTEHEQVRTILHAAFDAGINFFDIADVYARGESELAMGKVLAELPRQHLVISSKCFWPMSDHANDRGLSRKHVMESVEASLKRIGTDYLDIYFCHRHDPETPTEETVRAMDDLIHQGKILYWGTSEWSAEQIDEAQGIADRRNLYAPAIEQPQYNLIERHRYEVEVAPAAARHGMGTVVWSPLASGLLSGKYDDGVPADSRLGRINWLREKLMAEELVAAVKGLLPIAERLGCTRAQLALAWAARHPQISSVITGATSLEQLQENLGALDVEVDDATAAEIDALFPCVARPAG